MSTKRALFCFRRYAACPVCNQHLATFRVRGEEIRRLGVDMYTVFHSPEARIHKYFDPEELPFEVIADPGFEVYERFGVTERLTAKFAIGSFAAAFRASRSGLGDRSSDAVDGTSGMVPANFMVEDGTIVAAHYGRHLGDAWSVEQTLGVIDRLWGSGPEAAPAGRHSPAH